MDASKNQQNMEKLDDSWNAQDLETFRRYHAKDCIVRWPNQPPTHGIEAHEQEAIAFFKMFPDQRFVTILARSCSGKANGLAGLRICGSVCDLHALAAGGHRVSDSRLIFR